MWERHTPEHSEFRRQLFLRICNVAKVPASNFQPLLSLDQYTPEQVAEVNSAQARLGAFTPATPGWQTPVQREPVAIFRSKPAPEQRATPKSSGNGALPLSVWRLWTPFSLGLNNLKQRTTEVLASKLPGPSPS